MRSIRGPRVPTSSGSGGPAAGGAGTIQTIAGQVGQSVAGRIKQTSVCGDVEVLCVRVQA